MIYVWYLVNSLYKGYIRIDYDLFEIISFGVMCEKMKCDRK